jgi:hypothetical protein
LDEAYFQVDKVAPSCYHSLHSLIIEIFPLQKNPKSCYNRGSKKPGFLEKPGF